jgi:hypothetical protein
MQVLLDRGKTLRDSVRCLVNEESENLWIRLISIASVLPECRSYWMEGGL